MKYFFCALSLVMIASLAAKCQDTVFKLLKKDAELAEEYYDHRNFQKAAELYMNIAEKNPAAKELQLKIARCYYFLKQYGSAAEWYAKYEKGNKSLSGADLYYYAEALSGIQRYDQAIASYRSHLAGKPDDELVLRKVWRLKNIRFLYEDSIHYAIRQINVNSEYGDLCPVRYAKGLVFMSNRREVQVVDQIDGSSGAPFYKLFYSRMYYDTGSRDQTLRYESPVPFNRDVASRYHAGPVTFYDNDRKMVFAATGRSAKNGSGTLHLYFAELRGEDWKVTGSYPYNSAHYSITCPTISNDGKTLYFSSDKVGGMGGKDLYRSEFIHSKWTEPVNLGDRVNTPYDEEFPFLHNGKILYFSSNGHAGLGGLDIFKTDISKQEGDEIQNIGYPLNSHFDEFGIVMDSLSTHGYISSNRKAGGYDDDIYEFDIDLQTYPLVISGRVKHREHSWVDSTDLKPLPNARLYLIDNIRNIVVHESFSDPSGNFSIAVPYFSKYKIKVVGGDGEENIVSLEIPRHRKLEGSHEIVVIKNPFKAPVTELIK